MRHFSWWITGTLLLGTLGCSTGGSQSPLAPAPAGSGDPAPQTPAGYVYNGSGALGAPLQSGDISQSALALYTIDVDPSSLTATATLKELRQGTATDDLYLLPIDSFLRPTSFSLTGVSRTADTLLLGWKFAHPFPAPSDPAGTPNGSTNRADLGIAAALLYLPDVASASGNTYFTDRVANTALVTNADSYYSPGALIDSTGLTANTFPLQMVVNEAADNRLGSSNGSLVTGNYGTDGWTRSELGAGNNQWTGYDILHQGQVAAGTLELSLAELTGGFSLDVAVLANYNDPRGGTTGAQKKANRLPPASPDTSLFAYRMPHGAWDVSGVTFLGQDTPFLDNAISAATLSFHVTDWDARATETAEADLANDANPTNVAIGEAGLPEFAICIPGVLGDDTVIDTWDTTLHVLDDDSAFGGDVSQDSGQRGDALLYSKLVTEPLTSQAAGSYTGLARATDPSIANITDPFFVIELDGTLSPLTSNIPTPVAYGVFTAEVATLNTPPSANAVLTTGDPMNSGTQPALSITAIADAELDPLTISVDWGDGAGFQTIVSGLNSPYANQTPTGPQMNNADLVPDTINVTVRVSDGIAPPVDYPLSYTLGANRPPQVTGTPALSPSSVVTPATFNMVLGTATATDPEGDTVGLHVVNNRNADTVTSGFSFPLTPNPSTPVTNPPHSSVTFTVYATDALHPTTSGTAYPAVNGNVTTGLATGWVYTATATTTGIDELHSIATDSSGNVYGIGFIPNSTPGVDLGGGLIANGAFQNSFLVKINEADGTYAWHRRITTSNTTGRPVSIELDGANNIYVLLIWGGTLNLSTLGGGAVDQTATGTDEIGIIKFDNDGNYLGFARSNTATSAGSESPPYQTIAGSGLGMGSRALAIDKSTNAVYMGFSPTSTGASTTVVGGVSIPITGVRDPVVVRFNGGSFLADGSTTAVWGHSMVASAGATINQRINGLAVTGAGGNVVVTGQFDGLTDFGDGSIASVGGQDVFIVLRNPTTGAHIASSTRNYGTAGLESAPGVAADSSNVYVSGGWGSAAGQILTFGAPASSLTNVGSNEGYVVCYTASLTPVWARGHLGIGSGEHQSGGVALTATDVYVLGLFNSTSPGADFGYGPKIPTGSTDWSLAKFARADGALTGWQQVWGPPASSFDTPYAIALSNGNPVFTARSQTGASMDFDPGPGVVTRTMLGSDWAVVRVLAGNGEF